ncbi:ZBT24-like protein [Mya arenaria]|uniref:ZBT24-like protein n=1 Tax=Mya arenaria TaxID=6604 RepID=A0ABY7ESS6_MYAAR|nr:zinc finger protein 37-like [Mya arenaria]WAR12212.1 ZBT24-like protein [Mya arenaria]
MEAESVKYSSYRDLNQNNSIFQALNIQRLESKLCDVVLKVYDANIYAHSCVLAAASPYFEDLFCVQDQPRTFSQNNPQIIEIHFSFDGQASAAYVDAVRKIISFMYTNCLTLGDDAISEVAEIAKIMQMTSVIDFCELFLQNYDNDTLKDCTANVATQTSDFGQTFSSTTGFSLQPNRDPGPASVPKRRGRPKKARVNNSTKQDLKSDGTNDTSDSFCFKVSKRGRIIKPKKYSEEVVNWENEDEEDIRATDFDEMSNKVTVKEEPDETDEPAGEMDDEVTDPTFVTPKLDPDTTDSTSEKLKTISQYVCCQCDFVAEKLSEFNDHEILHAFDLKKCPFCEWLCEATTTLPEFEEHMKSHEAPDTFCCNFCQSIFNTKAKLHQHLPKHSKIRPYVCSICDAGFKWKHALKAHKVTHKNSKDYLCDLCGYATVHKNQLKGHYLIHSGDTFKCPEPECDYQSTKKSNLKFHMVTHTKEKPHLCGSCGTRFSLVKNLKRHMLLHTMDRPYRCDLCSFSSTRFDKLKEHYYKAHNVGKKPAKKLRLTDYIKQQDEGMLVDQNMGEVNENEEETHILHITDNVETIELKVPDDLMKVEGATHIVNVTSSTGETVPISITNNGKEISYEIQKFPFQIASQEVV